MPENLHNNWVVDLGRWPLVLVRPPSDVPEQDLAADIELDEFYQSLEQVFSRRRPFVALYDMRGVRISARRRGRMSEWSSQNDNAVRAHMIALAVVVGTELERAQVTAGFFSLKQSYHARIFESLQAAELWLLSEFARGEGAN